MFFQRRYFRQQQQDVWSYCVLLSALFYRILDRFSKRFGVFDILRGRPSEGLILATDYTDYTDYADFQFFGEDYRKFAGKVIPTLQSLKEP